MKPTADNKINDKQKVQHNKQSSGKTINTKVFYLVQFVVLFVIAFAIFTVFKAYTSLDSYIVAKLDRPYEVKSGYTAKKVIRDLTDDSYYDIFVDMYLYLNKDLTHILKGRYSVDGTLSLKQILTNMNKGLVVKEEPMIFTIVEGTTLEAVENKLKTHNQKVQEALAAGLIKDQASIYYLQEASFEPLNKPYDFILASLNNKELIKYFSKDITSLEGLLLPATYPYYDGDNYLSVIKDAINHMAVFLDENYARKDDRICKLKSAYEVLILASLIERESSLDSERALIAGVFCNRLNRGMRLQTDPAVMYGISPVFKGPLLKKHLQQDHPYNTYTRVGLPPTPIANPSVKSILAALMPQQTDAIYFVAKGVDPKDGHIFSNSLNEHNQAVRTYKQKVREYRTNNNE